MNNPFHKQVGTAIRSARQRALLKQAELGAALTPAVERSTIANYEASRRTIPLETLVQIARVLDVALDDLIPGASDATAEPTRATDVVQIIQQAVRQRPDIAPHVLEFIGLLLAEPPGGGEAE
jgi:transcriptional regulator with XRE-family HTH domain